MSNRTLGSPCNQAGQVQKYLGTAYDVVKTVHDNLPEISLVSEMLSKYGVLLCFNSAADLATIDPTLATFARVYDTSDPLNLYYKDYVYQAENTDGLAAKNGIGSWVEMDSINSVFGSMAWVYNGGSAIGGETQLTLDIETLSITDLFINGSYQTYGLNFSFDPATQVVTLSQELLEGDMVVAKLSGVPALAPGSSVDNFHFLNFIYNEGAALGGETVISTGIPFMNITSVFRNGARLLYGKDFTYSATSYTITFTKPLIEGEVVQATLGGNLDTLSEATGVMASKTVAYYQRAKDLIDEFGLNISLAQGYANSSESSARKSALSAGESGTSAASAKDAQAAAEAAQKAAETARLGAESALTDTENSAQQGANAATDAKKSASAAAASADAAADQASAATGRATAAAASATAAALSENNADVAATTATDAANTAQNKADVAAQNAQQAINAQSLASQSADTANKQAIAATNAGSAAAASEANAKTSETSAKSSETNAATSEKNAKTSETSAKASADAAATAAASYSNLQSGDAGKGDELLAVKAPYANAVQITQHTKNLESVYAPEMGLVPGTLVQTLFNNALKAAAAAGKELVVPAGTYTISGSIVLPSNTRLRLEPGCVIQRDPSGTTMRIMLINAPADATVGGYLANQNIMVYGGGTIDGNSAMLATGTGLMAFSHCTNVRVENLDLINGGGSGHALEFNACQNAWGVNVRANNAGTNTVVTNEAFQIDAAISNVTFPWFGPYDMTACDHVGFLNCQAIGYGTGIGTNSDGTNNHKNIVLRDNRLITNVVGINMMGWDNVNVENNEISWGGLGTMIAGIQATYNTNASSTRTSTNLNIKDNYIHDIVPADLTVDPGTNWYGIRMIGLSSDITKVRDLILHHNHIENTGNAAIACQYLTNMLLAGNRLGNPKCTGAAGLESLDVKDCNRVQCLGNRLEGSVTVGKGTATGQTHIFKDNWVGGTLATGGTLFAKGAVSGNHAVTAVPATLSETARIVANNTVG
ncbi:MULTISPECIES: hypothetical protein [Pantoea]|jgi:hypothetical protein|uniref:Pectate lyase superfamily protein domain-containing protein n=1 Tax=Pantoea brenneri TaxID=472694 RepID=A0A7Y6NH11_9GAMM|nr:MULTISPECIES: hypothetical protein [Pantoea]MBZ6397046.1 hypothetical protein [Pantoea sp.]MBZ6440203.1 hypothetical protein [Pantoea sp.]NUY43435.1 hypothetical protein [Pantoea brenneri]NUY50999.1 hypothetical protein [Pantoea brenneri]NUY61270.1 hypothetical protein [Pantoea brenneri]